MRHGRAAALALAAALVTVPFAQAAVRKPAARKPAAKKPAPRVVLGTTQLKGDQAQFGLEYTLGKSNPMNITLKSAAYSVEPLAFGDRLIVPKGSEKLLVLRYNLHNPQPREALVRFDTFRFTVVDSQETNREYVGSVGAEESKLDLSARLKPGQRMDAYTAVLVPAKAEMPKLIIKGSDNLVLRYDLRGKAKPLAAPFADPADPTGFSALEKVTAEQGTFYPHGELDLRLDGVSYTEAKLMNRAPYKGSQYVVLNVTLKNRATGKRLVRFDSFRWSLSDQDGARVNSQQSLLSSSRDADLSTQLEPGQELKARWVLQAPKDVQPQGVDVQWRADSRVYSYSLKGA